MLIIFLQVHGSLEILFLLLLSLELGIRMKWLGLKAYFKQHPRTILKVTNQCKLDGDYIWCQYNLSSSY